MKHRASSEIDGDKLRAAIRKLSNEHIFYMLSDAIDMLPPAKLHKLSDSTVTAEWFKAPDSILKNVCLSHSSKVSYSLHTHDLRILAIVPNPPELAPNRSNSIKWQDQT